MVDAEDIASCFHCGGDLRDTWNADGCGRCGFYFDGEHLEEGRRAELDELQRKYEITRTSHSIPYSVPTQFDCTVSIAELDVNSIGTGYLLSELRMIELN